MHSKEVYTEHEICDIIKAGTIIENFQIILKLSRRKILYYATVSKSKDNRFLTCL